MEDMAKWCFEKFDDSLYVIDIGYEKSNEHKKIGPRIRDSYAMHIVTKGYAFFNKKKINTLEGFIICPDSSHSFEFFESSEWEHFWIEFNGDNIDKFFLNMGIEKINQAIKFDHTQELKNMLFFMYGQYNTISSKPLFLLSVINYIASCVQRKKDSVKSTKSNQEIYVDNAIKYINEKYYMRICMDEVANFVKISEKYLCKLFKNYLGLSPQEYLKRVRFKNAENLLRTTELSISEIARSVGYENSQDFTQLFKKARKITPSMYRTSHKKR